jgi:hypothetical protein
MVKLKMVGSITSYAMRALPFAFLPTGEKVKFTTFAKLASEKVHAFLGAKLSSSENGNSIVWSLKIVPAVSAITGYRTIRSGFCLAVSRAELAKTTFRKGLTSIELYTARFAWDHLSLVAKMASGATPRACDPLPGFDLGRVAIERRFAYGTGRVVHHGYSLSSAYAGRL